MPLDLPGFYWDESRQRYFPVTTRSTQPFGWQPTSSAVIPVAHTDPIASSSSTRNNSGNSGGVARPRKRRRLASSSAASTATFAEREQIKHDTMNKAVSRLSRGSMVYSGDFPCSSFHASEGSEDGSTVLHTGDMGGWLQSCRIDPHGFAYNSSRELYLGSEVTALCHSGTLRVAVSFGPSSKIALENTAHDSDMWTIVGVPDKRAHDLRVADLQGSRLAIGAANRGLVFPDVEYSWHFEVLNMGSDVLSICQKDSQVYTGGRNGSIKAFDIRVNTQREGQSLFGERFTKETRSITHMNVINEWQMVVSTIRGDLELLDLRFPRTESPLTSFQGHVNSYTTKLGITTSPFSSYLFAAGQDNRLRAWSLCSTASPYPIEVPTHADLSSLGSQQSISQVDPSAVHLLRHTFKDPIVCLRVQEAKSSGAAMTLWAASGKDMWRFGIGSEFDPGSFDRTLP